MKSKHPIVAISTDYFTLEGNVHLRTWNKEKATKTKQYKNTKHRGICIPDNNDNDICCVGVLRKGREITWKWKAPRKNSMKCMTILDNDDICGLVGVHKVEAKLDRKQGSTSIICIHHKYKILKTTASGILLVYWYLCICTCSGDEAEIIDENEVGNRTRKSYTEHITLCAFVSCCSASVAAASNRESAQRLTLLWLYRTTWGIAYKNRLSNRSTFCNIQTTWASDLLARCDL